MLEGVFSKSKRIMMLESEVDIVRRELESYKHFRKKDDERNYEKITKCIAKTDFVEVQIEGAMMPLKRRIDTLEQQVVDAMNREEEWKRRLAKIETGMIVDQMKVDGVWKDEEHIMRVGDVVLRKSSNYELWFVHRIEPQEVVLTNGVSLNYIRNEKAIDQFIREFRLLSKKEDLK